MDADYKKLDFKCGLEIHQQLEGKKLFCECPTLNATKKPDIQFTRILRAVAGETGEVDVAAKHEMAKERKITYVASVEDTCLVEFDEEPPHNINQDALRTTVQIAKLLHASVVDEVQVMRKTVVDGSNVSGFQRTALIAVDGYLNSSLGRVVIPTICLEEEAAQKLDEQKGASVYKLDRLGIPLIEISTDASLKSPDHAKEVAGLIGMVLRSVEGVKRGLGTIRQDVNVSIKGGARTEIKGFQDFKAIPKVIAYEIQRQLDEIKKGKKLEKQVRKAEPDFTTSFLRPMPGAARMYPETDVPKLKITKELLSSIEVPELLSEKSANLARAFSISGAYADEIIRKKIDFEAMVRNFRNLEPSLIAKVLIDLPKEMRSRLKVESDRLAVEDFDEVLSHLNTGKVSKDAALDLLVKKAKKEKIDIEEYQGIDDVVLEKEIKQLIKEKPDLSPGAYMGLMMQKYRGKVDGKKVMLIVNKNVKP